jgi:tRNA(Ile)-lysidine synthase
MDAEARLVEQVRRCWHDLGEGAAGMVAAVSGGPDSVALLRALAAARPPGTALVIAHLNHCLRGAESDADEEFVARLHAELTAAGVPDLSLCRARADVAGQARQEGANLEATARRLRYDWLAEVARGHGLRHIATGHTVDDQAETVLHRLLRGTGLRGLRGIAAQRDFTPGIVLVRPLLRTTRAEVLAYLKELGQTSREDSSNRDLRHTRNRIRHELLPLLAERYNPGIVGVLNRLAEQAEETYRDEELAAGELLRRAELPRAGGLLIFDWAVLSAAPRRLVREMFRLAWAREGWPSGGMDHAAWERLAGLVFDGGRGVDLPGHVHARRRGRVVQVGLRKEEG